MRKEKEPPPDVARSTGPDRLGFIVERDAWKMSRSATAHDLPPPTRAGQAVAGPATNARARARTRFLLNSRGARRFDMS